MPGRTWTTGAAVAMVLLAGCSAGEAPGTGGTDLLGGPGSCEPLASRDGDLHDRIVAAIDEDTSYGPLVAVEVEGRTVAATTTYERPGVEGGSAAWLVEDGSVVAINAEAARISSAEASPIDSAGTDALAAAMAEAEDCSFLAADRAAPDPPEPEPEMRPDLMVPEPSVVAAGEELALRFPEETSRGIAFELHRRAGEGWVPTHHMSSDANGDEYAGTAPIGAEGVATIDVGVAGPGPDHVRLPDDLPFGEYRVCTANAGDEFCARVFVSHDGLACEGELRESGVLDYEPDPEPTGDTPAAAAEAQLAEDLPPGVEFRTTGSDSVEVVDGDGFPVGTVTAQAVTGGFVVESFTRCASAPGG